MKSPLPRLPSIEKNLDPLGDYDEVELPESLSFPSTPLCTLFRKTGRVFLLFLDSFIRFLGVFRATACHYKVCVIRLFGFGSDS
jgi:hypothetical protein